MTKEKCLLLNLHRRTERAVWHSTILNAGMRLLMLRESPWGPVVLMDRLQLSKEGGPINQIK